MDEWVDKLSLVDRLQDDMLIDVWMGGLMDV